MYLYMYMYITYIVSHPPLPVARRVGLKTALPRPPLVSDVLWHEKSCSCVCACVCVHTF